MPGSLVSPCLCPIHLPRSSSKETNLGHGVNLLSGNIVLEMLRHLFLRDSQEHGLFLSNGTTSILGLLFKVEIFHKNESQLLPTNE